MAEEKKKKKSKGASSTMYVVGGSANVMFFKRDPRSNDPKSSLLFKDTRRTAKTVKKKDKKGVVTAKTTKPGRHWYDGIIKGLPPNSIRKIKFTEMPEDDDGVNIKISTIGDDAKLGKVFVDFLISRSRGW